MLLSATHLPTHPYHPDIPPLPTAAELDLSFPGPRQAAEHPAQSHLGLTASSSRLRQRVGEPDTSWGGGRKRRRKPWRHRVPCSWPQVNQTPRHRTKIRLQACRHCGGHFFPPQDQRKQPEAGYLAAKSTWGARKAQEKSRSARLARGEEYRVALRLELASSSQDSVCKPPPQCPGRCGSCVNVPPGRTHSPMQPLVLER